MPKCSWCLDGGAMERYHDEEWGVVLHDDHCHFEYLLMEAMQCGLSWSLMIKKRQIFSDCFAGFDFRRVAEFGEEDVERILCTPGMIRSPRKVRAIIGNARAFLRVIGEWGSFDAFLWHYTDGATLLYEAHQAGQWETRNALSDAMAKDMKRYGFSYLGSVTLYSHLQACGMILDHDAACERYRDLLDNPRLRRL